MEKHNLYHYILPIVSTLPEILRAHRPPVPADGVGVSTLLEILHYAVGAVDTQYRYDTFRPFLRFYYLDTEKEKLRSL